MLELPVILLVQGSFQLPIVYQQLAASLQALGFVTIHPRLPSCTNTDDPDYPKTTLVDDALAVRLELTRQVEYEGKTVVVAMHSYGGLAVKPFLKTSATPNADGRMFLIGAEQKLYNDLSQQDASLWASRTLPSSHAVQTTKLTHAAWRYVPSTYLICENDQALPRQFQEGFAANAQAHVERCATGHSPMLSHTEMLAQRIHETAMKAIPGPAPSA
ncbi:MAG: hypothetical protein Q9170_003024 [Blastenia crenularia]